MEKVRAPVFHIGFPKAGSTSLQKQVFSRHSEITYLGIYPTGGRDIYPEDPVARSLPCFINPSVSLFYKEVFKKDGLNYDRGYAKKLLDEIIFDTDEKHCVFSHEGGLGYIFNYPDAVVKAERLQDLFGSDLRILIMIREQSSILASQYRDHPFDPADPLRGRPLSFTDWIKRMNRIRYSSFINLLKYDEIVSVYKKLFGDDNVLVLPLELLSYNKPNFSERLSNFIGVDNNELLSLLGRKPENVGNSAAYNTLRRLMRYAPNKFTYIRSLVPTPIKDMLIGAMKKGSKDNAQLTPFLHKFFEEKYADSNARLEEIIDVDLNSLGYKIGDVDSNTV